MKKKAFLILLFVVLILGMSGCKFIEADYILSPKETNDLTSEKQGNNDDEDGQEWREIEDFLKLIAKEKIDTIARFYLYGSEPGYERVPSQNYGYLPFYQNEDLDIIEEIVPKSNTYIRPGKERTQTKYIVIHNTGMASPSMSAKKLSSSINNSTREASWHFTIDDYSIYQQLYIDEIGWHTGTVEGNNYGIGIEMAVYQGIDLNMAMRRTAKLTAWLLRVYNLTLNDVKRHYDFSGKNCPQVLIEAERWEEFLDLVEIEYYGQKYLSEVEFNWKSLSSDSLDNQGRIISKSGESASIKYQVEVKFENKSRIYEFSSELIKMI